MCTPASGSTSVLEEDNGARCAHVTLADTQRQIAKVSAHLASNFASKKPLLLSVLSVSFGEIISGMRSAESSHFIENVLSLLRGASLSPCASGPSEATAALDLGDVADAGGDEGAVVREELDVRSP